MLLVEFVTLLISTDDELDILGRYIKNELPPGIYSCGINLLRLLGLIRLEDWLQ